MATRKADVGEVEAVNGTNTITSTRGTCDQTKHNVKTKMTFEGLRLYSTIWHNYKSVPGIRPTDTIAGFFVTRNLFA